MSNVFKGSYRGYRPWRVLTALTIGLIGLAVWTFWPGLEHTPRLGLDLQGGTQVTLIPKTVGSQENVNDDQLNQAVEIIRQRVDGTGVSEAEVTTQGSGAGSAIVVSVPGVNQQKLGEQIATTAMLDFRPVYTIGDPSPTSKAKTPKGPPIESASNNAALQKAFQELDCTNKDNLSGGTPDDPTKWIVTCSQDGTAKYLLEPAFIRGTEVTSAEAALPQQGGGGWQVSLNFDSKGASALAEASTSMKDKPPPQNQFAIVLDGLVQSSPYFSEAITGGQASISGSFTHESAQALANVLKYGALPVTLEIAEITTVSPTLGEDQLQAGIIAGIVGLLLTSLYLIFYYRALGIISVVSLLLTGGVTYALFVILGRSVGLSLTLAGIAGAIIAIGITVDSFIVYFERMRDEIREGRSLRVAAETGWIRARGTILAGDFVSLLGAVVLYYLSIGNVRGFAFMLGLTTVIDVAIAFWFTRPLVAILAGTKWFEKGGELTGMSLKRMGIHEDRVTSAADDEAALAAIGGPSEEDLARRAAREAGEV